MRRTKRLMAAVAAAAIGAGIGYGVITSPGPRDSAGVSSSPGTRYEAGFTTSPGRTLAARKAGKGQLEYLLLAIPGVRGTGGGAS
jgi:uncharacterized protein involved in exopolysaccharide biosynthesis